GFNQNLGWMHTSGYTDVADLYEEELKETANGWVYRYEGKALPVKTKPIT
ncbi:penicillin acylase family protein, partial [Pseudomonas aeruginosa]